MVDFDKLEDFIQDMLHEGIKVRLSIEYDIDDDMYIARMIDMHNNSTLLDVNGENYLRAEDDSVDGALSELALLLVGGE